MKCQPFQYSKHFQQNQISAVHSKGRHRLTQIHDSNFDNHKHQDRIINSMRQGAQSVRHCNKSFSDVSPRSSPTFGSFYAGAKFSGAPSPTDLPKPPSHWTNTPFKMSSGGVFPILHGRTDNPYELAGQMKILVNAPA